MKDSIIDNLENLRILITDDDLFMLRALEKVLTSIGFENIVTVGDGNEALEALSTDTYDLLLTDIQMPNLNGLQLLQQIRSGGATTARDMRTVIITSRSDMETMGAAIALDVNGFLAKPFKPIPVIKTILKALIEDDIELRDQEAYCAVSTDLDQLDRIADTDEGASTDRQVEGATWYTIPSLRPEMTLAQDVRSETGVLLLSAGFVLNKRAISRLRELSDETGCEGCYIQNVEPPLEDSAQL